ncbi:MAG: GIY-YIG nuclease family protein [Oscillospiraceae bacterium]|nr:GIY-YIG nuclease family protein [Oscillospiraceae bacterium]
MRGIITEYMPAIIATWTLSMWVQHLEDWDVLGRPNVRGAGAFCDNEDCSEQWSFMSKVIKQRNPKSAAVYFIENYDGSRVKIGRTKTLWRRYEEISQASGGDARIAFAIPTESEEAAKSLEHHFHSIFPGPHLAGEWFMAKDEGGSYIADMIAAIIEAYRMEGVEIAI